MDTVDAVSTKLALRGDRLKLPSGAIIDIDRPDFSLCETSDDFMEIKYALSEKVIDLEMQIDMFESGAGVAAGRSYAIDWAPRVRAALKWTKLYRDEAQNRQGRLTNIERARAHANKDRGIVDVLAAVLTQQQLETLHEIAAVLTKIKIEVKA